MHVILPKDPDQGAFADLKATLEKDVRPLGKYGNNVLTLKIDWTTEENLKKSMPKRKNEMVCDLEEKMKACAKAVDEFPDFLK